MNKDTVFSLHPSCAAKSDCWFWRYIQIRDVECSGNECEDPCLSHETGEGIVCGRSGANGKNRSVGDTCSGVDSRGHRGVENAIDIEPGSEGSRIPDQRKMRPSGGGSRGRSDERLPAKDTLVVGAILNEAPALAPAGIAVKQNRGGLTGLATFHPDLHAEVVRIVIGGCRGRRQIRRCRTRGREACGIGRGRWRDA